MKTNKSPARYAGIISSSFHINTLRRNQSIFSLLKLNNGLRKKHQQIILCDQYAHGDAMIQCHMGFTSSTRTNTLELNGLQTAVGIGGWDYHYRRYRAIHEKHRNELFN